MSHLESALMWRLLTLVMLAAGSSLGCNSSETSTTSAAPDLRRQLLVQQQPADVQSLKSTYADFPVDQELSEVTVAGRIYAQGMSPFDAKESVFTIMELPKPGHNHEDPGDCPFCARELKNAKIAIVRVVDAAGKTYPQSAEALLGLTKNQDIVVRGNASQIGDTLMIELQGLHLLQEAAATELATHFHGS